MILKKVFLLSLGMIAILFIACSVDNNQPPGGSTPFVEMVFVQNGAFSMGDNIIASPSHQVTLTRNFLISKHEITFGNWNEILSWSQSHGYIISAGSKGAGNFTTDDDPVTNVSWYDVVKWCNALSEKEGLAPIYYVDNIHTNEYVYRQGTVDVTQINVVWTSNGYRLPSEAEWEYTARAKGTTPANQHSGYDIDATVGNCAWYSENADTGSGSKTHPVATKKPDSLGLYDMSGNVWEWCWYFHLLFTKKFWWISKPELIVVSLHR